MLNRIRKRMVRSGHEMNRLYAVKSKEDPVPSSRPNVNEEENLIIGTIV